MFLVIEVLRLLSTSFCVIEDLFAAFNLLLLRSGLLSGLTFTIFWWVKFLIGLSLPMVYMG